ncbi:MAG: DUF3817 domain-containing protein [Planctomycetota bacterium]|nr:DUF3817 domain-containing protein [Planctomycetota bacterium]
MSDSELSFLRVLRWTSKTEGVSTLVLFGIAMPLKYLLGMPLAVTIVGTVHGFLFVGLVLMLAVSVRQVPLSPGLAFVGMVAAVIPFGPFWFDRKLHAQGVTKS